MGLNLIVEQPLYEEDALHLIVEEQNSKSAATYYVSGPYMMAEEINKNKRKYQLQEMEEEVSRFKKEMVVSNRSMGELNHPESAEINPERACHLITELSQDGNVFYGKSKILNTPLGNLTRSLMQDGVRLGMSSRSLGSLNEESEYDLVSDMKLITIDCVADPSFSDAFVNGVLESKQFVYKNGIIEECFDSFEKGLKKLPKSKDDRDLFMREQFFKLVKALREN